MVKEAFSGQWGIVLGGSSGLGLATVKKLADKGMNLFVIHRDRRSDMPAIEQIFETLREKVSLISYNMDALNAEKRMACIGEIKERLQDQKLHCLVHSIAKGNLKAISPESNGLRSRDFLLTIESMGVSLYDWVMDLLQAELFQPDSRVISFTSEGSYKAQDYYAAVSAAKASLESITRSMALELAPYGIKCNCILAGTTMTRSFQMIPGSEQLAHFARHRNPYNRLTQAEQVADAVYLLCLPEASWINGVTLPVTGGEHLR